VSHDSRLLIAVDEDGHSLLINLKRAIVLYRFNFKAPVRALHFSPDDRFIAVSHKNKIQVWHTPGVKRVFSPFVHYRTYGGHHGDVLSISWSPCSKFFLTSAKDLSVRLWSLQSYPAFTPYTFVGHRDVVVGAFFSSDGNSIYTISRDGGAYVWQHNDDGNEKNVDPTEAKDTSDNDEDEDDPDDHATSDIPVLGRGLTWSTKHKHVFKMDFAKVDCLTFHAATSLLVIGFSNGTFGLYSVPDFRDIPTLSVTQHRLHSVAINASGAWLAMASQTLGQLLVWEWKSETYVLKQQGHYFDLNVLAYSPDGRILATGADDAKLKLWDTTTGFCYVTFSEHEAPVTGVAFTSNGQAVVSCSLDGTVRAFDLNRYKNFRILTTPNPVQFLCLALDVSGQLVCAGTLDPFHIYVWSLQTGRLTDVLSGHTAPVTSLAFSPSTTTVPV
jgi:periodic tryptophan protein 2